MEQYNSGELKIIFRNISNIVLIGLTTGGRKAWQEEEDTRNGTTVVLIRQYFRALQGHSGRSLIDPTLQDNVVFSEQLLPIHLSCQMCVQSSFYHQLWIDTWRSKFEQ